MHHTETHCYQNLGQNRKGVPFIINALSQLAKAQSQAYVASSPM